MKVIYDGQKCVCRTAALLCLSCMDKWILFCPGVEEEKTVEEDAIKSFPDLDVHCMDGSLDDEEDSCMADVGNKGNIRNVFGVQQHYLFVING